MTKLRLVIYDKNTGNRLYDCAFFDNFIEPTIQQIHDSVTDLQPLDVNFLGLLRFENGEYDDNFAKYPYHVDTTTSTIIWDTTNPIGASLQDVQNSKMAQLNDMYKQTLASGFQATIGTIQHTFGWTTDDKANILVTQQGIDDGLITFPFDYADIYGNPVTLNAQTDLNLIKSKAAVFFNAQHQQILNLIGQVKAATTTDAVNTIQWTPASY